MYITTKTSSFFTPLVKIPNNANLASYSKSWDLPTSPLTTHNQPVSKLYQTNNINPVRTNNSITCIFLPYKSDVFGHQFTTQDILPNLKNKESEKKFTASTGVASLHEPYSIMQSVRVKDIKNH